MNTPNAHHRHRFRFTHGKPLHFRAELPALIAPHPAPTPDATHDFLVPNPRPDLITDPRTLRMIERR